MLKPRPGVILKIHGDERCLFDVRQGLMLPVNKMAAQIWRMIQEGSTEEQIVSKLQDSFGSNAPACLSEDIHEFLTSLQDKKLLIAEDAIALDALPAERTDNPRDGMPLYHYFGMYGVMGSGYDAVIAEEVPFAAIQSGDVIAIHPDGPHASGILYRVVRRTAAALTVQGEAESSCTRRIICAADAPQRVTALVDPTNERHEIHGGSAGLWAFRWHRVCRVGRIIRDLLTAAMPWRKIPAELLVVNGEKRYFDGRRLVARCWGETAQYLPWWKCFRYKIEK